MPSSGNHDCRSLDGRASVLQRGTADPSPVFRREEEDIEPARLITTPSDTPFLKRGDAENDACPALKIMIADPITYHYP